MTANYILLYYNKNIHLKNNNVEVTIHLFIYYLHFFFTTKYRLIQYCIHYTYVDNFHKKKKLYVEYINLQHTRLFS